MPYIYILRSKKDLNKYIGSTSDLERRLKQHELGLVISTKYRRPLKLIAYQITETLEEARILESKYKRSHGFLERMMKKNKFIILDSGM